MLQLSVLERCPIKMRAGQLGLLKLCAIEKRTFGFSVDQQRTLQLRPAEVRVLQLRWNALRVRPECAKIELGHDGGEEVAVAKVAALKIGERRDLIEHGSLFRGAAVAQVVDGLCR